MRKVRAKNVRAWGRSRTGVSREVAVLATPLIFQNLSYTLLGVADTFFVSRVSTEALAAVGLAGILFFAVALLFRGTANSSVVFVGRAYGEKDDVKIGVAVWRCLTMVLWLSLLVFAVPWLFTWLFSLAAPADSPAVRAMGTAYLHIRTAEIPLVMFNAVVWGFLVGRGDSRTPMLLAWGAVLLNILFDWVLVLGNLGFPALGVAGAAYATVLATGINAVASAAILWRPRHRRLYGLGRPRLASWPELKGVLRVGLPMGVGDFITLSSFSVFFAIIARLGTGALAATQISLQYMSLSFTFGIAIAMAASSLVSRYLGAKQPEVAERVGYRASLLAMAGMGVIGLSYLVAPEALLRVFSQDPGVIAAGVTILRLVAFYQIFDAAAIVFGGALNGAGDTTFTMLTKAVFGWGVFLPLVWLLAFPLQAGIQGAWVGALVYLTGLAFIYFLRFRSGRWKKLSLN